MVQSPRQRVTCHPVDLVAIATAIGVISAGARIGAWVTGAGPLGDGLVVGVGSLILAANVQYLVFFVREAARMRRRDRSGNEVDDRWVDTGRIVGGDAVSANALDGEADGEAPDEPGATATDRRGA